MKITYKTVAQDQDADNDKKLEYQRPVEQFNLASNKNKVEYCSSPPTIKIPDNTVAAKHLRFLNTNPNYGLKLECAYSTYGRKVNLVDVLTKASENNKYMDLCKMDGKPDGFYNQVLKTSASH
jgi:hypothetical protein